MQHNNNNHKKNQHHKRIAMISVHGDPLAKLGGHATGGQNVYVLELSRYLGRLGWSVDVFVRLTRKRKKLVRNYGKNVRVIYIKAGPRYHVPKEKIFDVLPEFVGNVLTFKASNKLRYDILHGNYHLGGWVAAQLKRMLNIPMVQTFHSLGHIRNHALENISSPSRSRIAERRSALENRTSTAL